MPVTTTMPSSTPTFASVSVPASASGLAPAPTPITGLLLRPAHTRTPSHTYTPLAISPMNSNNRINRRKSVSSVTHSTVAAVASALESSPLALPGPSSKRYMATAPMPLSVKKESIELGEDRMSQTPLSHGSLSPPAPDTSLEEQSRLRRASDGQPLVREGGKRFNRVELRCETCGKSYKHSSCLTKHLLVTLFLLPLPPPESRRAEAAQRWYTPFPTEYAICLHVMWEHTPEWSYTSKLLISKHQQVQLLEAASVLVAMNHNDPKSDSMSESLSDSTSGFHSESDSVSTADSVLNRHERTSSTETTPPPMEGLGLKLNSHQFSAKRYSTGGISKAYKLGNHKPSTSILQGIASSGPNGSSSSHGRKRSEDIRPTSSGRSSTGKVDRELAAAVELLSCSFTSNNAKSPSTTTLAPPVPALPIQYLEQSTSFASSGFLSSFPSRQPESFTRGESFIRGSKSLRSDDVDMNDSSNESVLGDFDDDDVRRARNDEDDDGVFGHMEE
ncbi:c2h2 finger domain-containing [Ceratocystis lukuohia]|uniref:C2h2 finger domain-containing n=1 Tax=Ceratocystis lukuohia TaxID=2019550 RepID=A0ABR4MLH7_9PEZI